MQQIYSICFKCSKLPIKRCEKSSISPLYLEYKSRYTDTNYRKVSNIRRIKSLNLDVSRLIL